MTTANTSAGPIAPRINIKDHVLYNGDCLEVMSTLPADSVDLILTDPPYGTTQNKWDAVIPFERLWPELRRLRKDRAAVVMTASQPFTTVMVASNMAEFKYCWVWEKSRFANQMLAKKQPLKIHEDVSVFFPHEYHPQGLIEVNKETKQGARVTDNSGGGTRKTSYTQTHTGYPRSILSMKSEGATLHPTQKPVALMEYLIKTYTNEGDTVLDFTMGSGTTGVACANTGRKFIGIELDETYFNVAAGRVYVASESV